MTRARDITILVVSALALILAVWSGLKSQSYARCQAAVNDALISAQAARADSAEQDRRSDRDESEATATLIRIVFTATTRDQTLAAYEVYRRTLDEIQARRDAAAADRAANPIPAPPSQVCA